MEKTILIVEDDSNIRELLSLYLEQEGYHIEMAQDGADGLRTFKRVHPDLVLLDLMMPVMDGTQMIRELRTFSKTPVIILTAKGEVDDKILGLDAGADDYLTKPFAMGELLARIRALTRRKADFTPNLLSSGNLSLNRETFELSVGDESIRLGNKEFQMIEMLMNNTGRLISTEQFMEKIWGYETEAEINVVWVYISYLRKKLVSLNANVEIKAVRGVGYTLEEIKC